ncbi:MAG: hypothetical protein L3J83_08120 [Proteobacteria bacterium]|nr:hypothetical protein [Pseudomonadota bacterium]
MSKESNQADNAIFEITNIHKVAPLRVCYWINEGYRYFYQAKYTWILTLTLLVMVVLVSRFLLPVLQIALIFVFPFIVAGLSLACADIEQGKKMSVQYLLKGFASPNRLNIFRYGLLFFLMMIVAQIISSIVLNSLGISQEMISSEISLLQESQDQSFRVILESQVLSTFFATTIFSMLPILMINLFAPILIVFSRLSAFQAIKLSFVAGLKNLSALIVYLLIYIGIVFVVIFLFNFFAKFLFIIFGEGSVIASSVYLVLFFAFILSILSISYSSAYVAFKDIFLRENKLREDK